uniref:Uncharacterized protein n=1 Tax=Rangifer tarandus platyrhynchus TaxID=3082113 RepID=A0ACB0EQ59_RANTA|nr:unnamed protein product [Rangifer tarandus platyrhynchus]
MPGHKGAQSCRDKRAPPSRWAERASPRRARRRRRSHGRRLWEGGGGGGGHRPPRPGSKRPRPGRYPRPHRKPLAEPRARPEPTRHPQADPAHFPLTFLNSPNSPGAPPPPPQPPQQFPPEILPGLPAARLQPQASAPRRGGRQREGQRGVGSAAAGAHGTCSLREEPATARAGQNGGSLSFSSGLIVPIRRLSACAARCV